MRLLIATMLLTAQDAPARGPWPGPDFCDDIRIAIAAARASPPFSTLPPRTFVQGTALFGFAWPCRIEASGRALLCTQYLMGEREAERLAETTAHCLPDAHREPDEAGEGGRQGNRRTFPYYRARFRLPGLVIDINRSGNPNNHLGQFNGYRVALDDGR